MVKIALDNCRGLHQQEIVIYIENITTSRLTIRRLKETDISGFLAYHSHPEVRKFMPGLPMDEDQVARFLSSQASMQDSDRDVYHNFAVLLGEGSKIIGDIGMYLPSGSERVGDLGFQFHPDYHGQGYAFESSEALIRNAFLNWKLERVTASCDPRNVRSYGLMERLGMSRTESENVNDSLTYQLELSTWSEAYATSQA